MIDLSFLPILFFEGLKLSVLGVLPVLVLVGCFRLYKIL